MMPQLKHIAPLALALAVALSNSSQAQSVPTAPPNASGSLIFNAPEPPSTGQPGRRSDAGSRGCGEEGSSSSSNPIPLLALVPVQTTENATTVFGKTAAEYPTFWFYIPHASSVAATFVLQDHGGNPVYQSDIPLPQTAGIVSLTLPPTAAPLEADTPYHWFFKLYCRENSPPSSFVNGWIQRELLSPNLEEQVQTATLPQQVQIYAANGFWFEALAVAAKLRQRDTEASAWEDLLTLGGLEQVRFEAIALPQQ